MCDAINGCLVDDATFVRHYSFLPPPLPLSLCVNPGSLLILRDHGCCSRDSRSVWLETFPPGQSISVLIPTSRSCTTIIFRQRARVFIFCLHCQQVSCFVGEHAIVTCLGARSLNDCCCPLVQEWSHPHSPVQYSWSRRRCNCRKCKSREQSRGASS